MHSVGKEIHDFTEKNQKHVTHLKTGREKKQKQAEKKCS